jgi:hypothetical protein
MHNIPCMRISQRVRDETERWQDIRQGLPSQYADVGTVDKLQAVEGDAAVFVELEHAHDMCMQQPQIGLPLLPQACARIATSRDDLERNRRPRQTICREPGLRLATAAKRPVQRIPVG